MENQIQDYVAKLVADAEDGNISHLKAYGQLAQLEKLFSEAKKQLQQQALTELGDQKERIEHGMKFTLSPAKRRWKFDNVQAWKEKNEQIKALENELKKRYEFVASSGPGSMPVGEDGEVLELPRVEYTKEGLSVKPIK